MEYQLPGWSGFPSNCDINFEIIKDGSIIQTFTPKDKPFYLIGKLEDLCDIVLNHPSISRKHAVL